MLSNAAIHTIAAFAFVRSTLHLSVVFVVVLALGVSLGATLRAERRKAGCRLVLESNGELRLDSHGRVVYAVPDATSVDFGWVLWLHWRGAHVRQSRRHIVRGALMLLPGNVSAGDWRGLRIWLRHKAAPDGAKDAQA